MSLDASVSLPVESDLLSTSPDKHADQMASRDEQSNAFKNAHTKIVSTSASSDVPVKMNPRNVERAEDKRSGLKKITSEL